MAIGVGRAFLATGQNGTVTGGAVRKYWGALQNRTFLIEELPFASVGALQEALPAHASIGKPSERITRLAALERPRKLEAPKGFGSIRLAQAYAEGRLNFLTEPYLPVVLTGRDDDAAGEKITGSTGSPVAGAYANPALAINSYSASITNIRVSFARAVLAATDGAPPLSLALLKYTGPNAKHLFLGKNFLDFMRFAFLAKHAVAGTLVLLFANCGRLGKDTALAQKALYTIPAIDMVWGGATNFSMRTPFDLGSAELRAGIRTSISVILVNGNPPRLEKPVAFCLESLLGRPIWEIPEGRAKREEYAQPIFLPPESERMGITLTAADGREVPKTVDGQHLRSPSLSGKPWGNWDKDGRQYLMLLSHQKAEYYAFDPTKYFSIRALGVYKLTLVQHVYVIGTNRLLKAVDLPPVTVSVRVEK